MSDIDFQNGFVCGMASKGLIKSGVQYEPIIWNDDGIYDYFYIDFKRAMEIFSLGMAEYSLVVMDISRREITGVKRVSENIYQIFCDLSKCPFGVVLTNKKIGYLKFKDGKPLPAFSIHMFIKGQDSYLDAGFYYESIDGAGAVDFGLSNVIDSHSVTLSPAIEIAPEFETSTCKYSFSPYSQVTENALVELIGQRG